MFTHAARSIFSVLPLGCLVVFLIGCASPASRIKANPELYQSFPEAAQKKIAAGDLDIGFSPEMVTMAWGRPDRVMRERTKDGESEIWIYTRTRTRHIHSQTPVLVRNRDGDATFVYPQPVAVREQQERARVTLRGREVTSIQERSAQR